MGVASPQLANCIDVELLLRVEIHIGPKPPVKELSIVQHRHLWPDILHKEALAPARVCDNQIGREAPLIERYAAACGGLPMQRRIFVLMQIMVRLRVWRARVPLLSPPRAPGQLS